VPSTCRFFLAARPRWLISKKSLLLCLRSLYRVKIKPASHPYTQGPARISEMRHAINMGRPDNSRGGGPGGEMSLVFLNPDFFGCPAAVAARLPTSVPCADPPKNLATKALSRLSEKNRTSVPPAKKQFCATLHFFFPLLPPKNYIPTAHRAPRTAHRARRVKKIERGNRPRK
jgi:hypothetical protein